jgi:hypothetical protein
MAETADSIGVIPSFFNSMWMLKVPCSVCHKDTSYISLQKGQNPPKDLLCEDCIKRRKDTKHLLQNAGMRAMFAAGIYEPTDPSQR